MSNYDTLFQAAAKQHGVPLGLLRSVAQAESGMDPNATSKDADGNVIASGIAQLTADTAKSLGVTNAKDPKQAIPAMARLLKENLDASGGDERTALMMYHGGTDIANWGPKTAAYPGKVRSAQAQMMQNEATNSDPVFQFLNGDTKKAAAASATTGDATLDFFNSNGAAPASKTKVQAPTPSPQQAVETKPQEPGLSDEARHISELAQKASEKGGGGVPGLVGGGAALLTGLGANIVGGYKGLVDTGVSLAQGNPLSQALATGGKSVEDYASTHTYKPETPIGQLVPALAGLAGSVPGKVSGMLAGDAAAKIKGEQARAPTEAATEGATNVLLTALGGSSLLRAARAERLAATAQPNVPSGPPNPIRQNRLEPLVRVNADGTVTRLSDVSKPVTPVAPSAPPENVLTQALTPPATSATQAPGDLLPPIDFTKPTAAAAAQESAPVQPSQAVEATKGPYTEPTRLETEPQPVSKLSAEAASPDLKTVIEKAQKRGKPINEDALQRHLEADSLGINLTEGQATRDPSQISWEQNNRGKFPELAKRFNRQNGQIVQAINDIKAKAAPNIEIPDQSVGSANLIKSYETKLEAEHATIKDLYSKMNEANGGKFPVDGKAIVKAVEASPEWDFKKDFLPAPVQKILDRVASGKQEMNFAGFESLRTTLASEMRKAERAGDGNAGYALRIVRNEMEKLPMANQTAEVKALADEARAANAAFHAKLKADPAMSAVENGKAFPDDFVKKYVIGAKRQHVQALKASLADDADAMETLSAVTMNHLKRSAGLKSDSDNFSQSSYREALTNLGPKLDDLLPSEQAQAARTLGNVAFYTQHQPRGSFVNNSNTTVAGLAANAAKGTAEVAGNMLIPGAQAGSWVRNKAAQHAERNRITEILQPGAGIRK